MYTAKTVKMVITSKWLEQPQLQNWEADKGRQRYNKLASLKKKPGEVITTIFKQIIGFTF